MSDDNTDDSLVGLNRPLVSSDFPSLHSLVQDSGDTTPFNSPKIMANLSRASWLPRLWQEALEAELINFLL